MTVQEGESLLTGENAAFLDEQYSLWIQDSRSVDPEWAALFESWGQGGPGAGQPPRFSSRSIFNPMAAGGGSSFSEVASRRQAKVAQLINAFRVRGHMMAAIDPLHRRELVEHPELTLEYYGLSSSDLDESVSTTPLFGIPPIAPLREVLARCHEAYADAIGAEFMNIDDLEQKQWVQQRLETLPDQRILTHDEERWVLRKLADAENFERMLHTRFPGTKRFSLEGAETLIPLLELLLNRSSELGVKEVVFGMAHRGRLNCLANILEKPVLRIVQEFEDVRSETVQGSGDVKYHLAYSADRQTPSGAVHLSLTPNPSHLEAVDPVVQGRVRAKQDRDGDSEHRRTMAVLVHGDAAFAGQGLVVETLNMSELEGYATGGTIHIVVNNQIGFTTVPREGRSMMYATGFARMLGVPIFHVNGENPRAVAAVVKMAAEWRHTFQRDVVIDMYCYRKYGHNEGDEPAFTQPQMYRTIRGLPTPREVFSRMLVERGHITEAEADLVVESSRLGLEQALQVPSELPSLEDEDEITAEVSKGLDLDEHLYTKRGSASVPASKPDVEVASPLKGLWSRYLGGRIDEQVDTRIAHERLCDLIVRTNTLPDDFAAHAKIKRVLKQRRQTATGERPIDWAVAEQSAYASLVTAGYRVRLSGQDSGRGTFSHRHAELTDIESTKEYYPLAHLAPDQAPFEVINSPLSEAGVLGFEVGYAMDFPDALVVWEAQFGDFANGAQVIIDQFIAASEQKWSRLLGIVMLLPHGYEGQGPEHSSARLERFLELCADENMQVANCTTPANFFHLLRRQVIGRARKPLIVMSPKSLLRHPSCVSTLSELTDGVFQAVIRDPSPPARVRRQIFCSGKVYYDLARARTDEDVAIHRVEMLHPFPATVIAELVNEHPDAEVVWCQEEPKNAGGWPSLFHWFYEHLTILPRYVGRRPSASPATGYHDVYRAEQAELIRGALTLS